MALSRRVRVVRRELREKIREDAKRTLDDAHRTYLEGQRDEAKRHLTCTNCRGMYFQSGGAVCSQHSDDEMPQVAI